MKVEVAVGDALDPTSTPTVDDEAEDSEDGEDIELVKRPRGDANIV